MEAIPFNNQPWNFIQNLEPVYEEIWKLCLYDLRDQ